ncbi:thiopeptide-type bacteriocin biosynthesis protein [Actinokineospora sp.]|uniref:thiopeptide-type bacteriocin biosynthesis protein n=1 Tax=Actinokineospora sp. TaxID=1872133 RepID=UPI00403761D3
MTRTAPEVRQWISVHVFYASNANPMLVDCVRPLVAGLRERGLITRFFFITYWLEGPHVRIRLLPAPDADPDVIRAELEAALAGFLRRRPALYDADRAGMDVLYRRLYVAEYGEQSWAATYGDAGMPFRANNSFDYLPYEPEYDRYGGPAGLEVSEWHFEKSSDIVLRLLGTTNVHVRTVLLGQSVQLAAVLCFEFLRTADRVARFLTDYRTFWETNFQEDSPKRYEVFDASYARMAPRLTARVAEIRDRVAGRDAELTALETEWLNHVRDLRARTTVLAERGELVFARGPVSDVDSALAILLSSYLHMTNNRLGVTIADEVYLSYILRKAVLDSAVRA